MLPRGSDAEMAQFGGNLPPLQGEGWDGDGGASVGDDFKLAGDAPTCRALSVTALAYR